MFALRQLLSLDINTTTAISMLAQLLNLDIQNVIEDISAEGVYIHLAYLFFGMAGLLLISNQMRCMQIGPFKCDFSIKGPTKNPNFYIALFLIALAIAFLLANPQAESPNSITSNHVIDPQKSPSQRSVYPQAQCGDDISQLSRGTHFKLYPVFVAHDNMTLTNIKINFCQDAFLNPENGMIQVASFMDKDKANHFRKLMEKEFGSALIGPARPKIKS